MNRNSPCSWRSWQFDIIGKGAKYNTIYVLVSTYEKSLEMAKERGSFYVNKDTYRDKVNAAANAAGEVKTNVSLATHSIRWSGASARFWHDYEQSLFHLLKGPYP